MGIVCGLWRESLGGLIEREKERLEVGVALHRRRMDAPGLGSGWNVSSSGKRGWRFRIRGPGVARNRAKRVLTRLS